MLTVGVLAAAAGVAWAATPEEEPHVVPPEKARSIVEVTDVSADVSRGIVEGTSVNRSDGPVHDVELLVQYYFFWVTVHAQRL